MPRRLTETAPSAIDSTQNWKEQLQHNWRIAVMLLGILLSCIGSPYTLLIVPFVFGGAFGPLVGGVVGSGGSLLISAFSPMALNSQDFGISWLWWQSWLFFALAGIISGLTLHNRNVSTNKGVFISFATLAITNIFITVFDHSSPSDSITPLDNSFTILAVLIVAMVLLALYKAVYKAVANQINRRRQGDIEQRPPRPYRPRHL